MGVGLEVKHLKSTNALSGTCLFCGHCGSDESRGNPWHLIKATIPGDHQTWCSLMSLSHAISNLYEVTYPATL